MAPLSAMGYDGRSERTGVMSGSNFDRMGRLSAPQYPATDVRERRQAGIRAAMAQVKDGQTIPAEDVEAWIESWDTPDELPMPEPRRR